MRCRRSPGRDYKGGLHNPSPRHPAVTPQEALANGSGSAGWNALQPAVRGNLKSEAPTPATANHRPRRAGTSSYATRHRGRFRRHLLESGQLRVSGSRRAGSLKLPKEGPGLENTGIEGSVEPCEDPGYGEGGN